MRGSVIFGPSRSANAAGDRLPARRRMREGEYIFSSSRCILPESERRTFEHDSMIASSSFSEAFVHGVVGGDTLFPGESGKRCGESGFILLAERSVAWAPGEDRLIDPSATGRSVDDI